MIAALYVEKGGVYYGLPATALRRCVCLLRGHRLRTVVWISPEQPRSVNCQGDHWMAGRRCERCSHWALFRAGIAFVRRGNYWPIVEALGKP